MYAVVRHAQKGPDLRLTERGRKEAVAFGSEMAKLGFLQAVVAPNTRAKETAGAASLVILGTERLLAIPDEYDEYLNGPVVENMLQQPGEKSYTRAVLEDPRREEFLGLGEITAAAIMSNISSYGTRHVVFIGSSPIIELTYLAFTGSKDWQDFPRCRELSGFFYDPRSGRSEIFGV